SPAPTDRPGPRKPVGATNTVTFPPVEGLGPGAPRHPDGPVTPAGIPSAPTVRDVPQPPTPRGCRPTLYVGLGGLAGRALRGVKRRLHDLHLDQHSLAEPLFRFLHVDTDRTALHQAPDGPRAAGLSHEELLHCPLRQPDHYREQTTALLRWLPRRLL